MKRLWMLGVGMALVAGMALAQDTLMGDYEGTREGAKLCAQVIDWGNGDYQANLLKQFDTREPAIVVLKGKLADGKVALSGAATQGDLKDTEWTATLEGEALAGSYKGAASGKFELKKVVRLSPTLGAKPPEGAVVLFDGTNMDAWQTRDGKPVQAKLFEDEKAFQIPRGGIISGHKLSDFKLHLEFRTPFMPTARGQGRGNSGVYLQGRYEVQVLDSYGLEGRDNECGGIYSVGAPRVNMCVPPLQWQTYDITFHAPRFDADGKKTKDATITVLHNSVLIQEDKEIPNPTTANWGGDIHQPNGVHLQDHGNPVCYRNIWAVELKPGEEK